MRLTVTMCHRSKLQIRQRHRPKPFNGPVQIERVGIPDGDMKRPGEPALRSAPHVFDLSSDVKVSLPVSRDRWIYSPRDSVELS